MEIERNKKPRSPLDPEGLERLALFYVGRYATTRAKLRTYLSRKLKERGWAGANLPDLEALAERMRTLGYLDDSAFAAARAASLQRRGYGERRVRDALRAAGVDAADRVEAQDRARSGAMDAALRFAKRKRLGPYGEGQPDREALRKAFAALMRAGHSVDIARQVLNASPGVIPDLDND